MLLPTIAHEMKRVRDALKRVFVQIMVRVTPEPTSIEVPPDADEEMRTSIHEANHAHMMQHLALRLASLKDWKEHNYDSIVQRRVQES